MQLLQLVHRGVPHRRQGKRRRDLPAGSAPDGSAGASNRERGHADRGRRKGPRIRRRLHGPGGNASEARSEVRRSRGRRRRDAEAPTALQVETLPAGPRERLRSGRFESDRDASLAEHGSPAGKGRLAPGRPDRRDGLGRVGPEPPKKRRGRGFPTLHGPRRGRAARPGGLRRKARPGLRAGTPESDGGSLRARRRPPRNRRLAAEPGDARRSGSVPHGRAGAPRGTHHVAPRREREATSQRDGGAGAGAPFGRRSRDVGGILLPRSLSDRTRPRDVPDGDWPGGFGLRRRRLLP